MSDTPLKVIRARKNKKAQKNNAGKGGDLDLKVSIYKAGVFNNKRKIVVTDNSGNAIQGKDPIEYSTNGRYSSYTELDFIKDYLDTLIKLEGGTSSVTPLWNENTSTKPGYQIIQDPWESRVPIIRDFGNDSYYLNNGVIVDILWFYEKRVVIGTYSLGGEVEEKYKTTYIPDGGVEWCDKNGFDIDTRENSEIIRGTFSSSGGAFINPNKITKIDIAKTVKLTMPDGSIYGIGNIPENEQKLKTGYNYDSLAIVKYNDRKRINAIDYDDDDNDNWIKVEYYDSNITDWNLLNSIKDLYCLQLQRNKFVSNRFDYKLEICRNPDYDACHVNGGINFINPITGAQNKDEPPKEEKKEEVPPPTTDNSKTNATGTKIKLNIVLPNGFKAIANMDMNPIDIFVGDIPPVGEAQGIYRDVENVDGTADVLAEEYSEEEIVGDGEVIATPEEYKIEMAAAQADSEKTLEPSSSVSSIGSAKGLAPNTPLPSKSTIPAGFNNTPLYSQYDTRWAKSPYDYVKGKSCGDNSTVASSGCGPSAVSMVINYWASKGYCDPVTPAIVAKFFADFGGRVCGSGSGLGNVPKDKFKSTFGMVLKVGVSEADIMTALRKGYPCVISGKGYTGYNFSGTKLSGKYSGGHFVCLTGIDLQGRIRVNDSGNNPSGGKAITAFLENESISSSTSLNQKAILYPSSMESPV